MTPEQMALFEAHKPLADTVARNFRIAGEAFESVQQDALMGLHKAVLAYNPEKGEFEPFARTVIKNLLRSKWRSLDYKKTELTILDEPQEGTVDQPTSHDITDHAPDPAHEAERNEIRAALRKGLACLTPAQREVLEHYAQGGSFAEIARQKGISEQAVRQMFDRGSQQVRTRLMSGGIGSGRFLPNVEQKDAVFSLPERPKKRRDSSGCLAVAALLFVVGSAIAGLLQGLISQFLYSR